MWNFILSSDEKRRQKQHIHTIILQLRYYGIKIQVYITVYAYFSGQISSETCRNLVSCKGYITPSHYLLDLFPYKNLQYILLFMAPGDMCLVIKVLPMCIHSAFEIMKFVWNAISFIFVDNLYSRYTMKDRIIGEETHGNRLYGEVVADITSSLMVLLAIYFPSVTGRYS